MFNLFRFLNKNTNYAKPTITALPILQLEKKEKMDKTQYFEEITHNYETIAGVANRQISSTVSPKPPVFTVNRNGGLVNEGGMVATEFKHAFFKSSTPNPKIPHIYNNIFTPERSYYLDNVKNLISGNFTDQEFWWITVFDTESYLDPTVLSLVYLNILALLLFTFLFIEYPLVPILFVIELAMFIPVLLLYVFATESVFVFLIYIINAVTVEAVSAVGIAMSYLMGWKLRDITSRDVLEANLFYNLLFKNMYKAGPQKSCNDNSWYVLNRWKINSKPIKILQLFWTFKTFILLKILLFLLIYLSLDIGFQITFLKNQQFLSLLNLNKVFEKNFTIFYWENNYEFLKYSKNSKYLKTDLFANSKHFAIISEFFIIKNTNYFNFNKNNQFYHDWLTVSKSMSLENLHKNEFQSKLKFVYPKQENLRFGINNCDNFSLEENPTNVLINLGILETSLLRSQNYKNKLSTNYEKNDIRFYQTNKNQVAVKNLKNLKINKLSVLYYEMLQLRLLNGFNIFSDEGSDFLKNYNQKKKYLSNSLNIFYKSKKKKLNDLDSNLMGFNTTKLEALNSHFNFDKKNITRFTNTNLNCMNNFNCELPSVNTPFNCFKVEFLFGNDMPLEIDFERELNFLNFEKMHDSQAFDFYVIFSLESFLNPDYFGVYEKIYKKLTTNLSNFLIVNESKNYKINYKFYFKKNKKYLYNFSSKFKYFEGLLLSNQNNGIVLKTLFFNKTKLPMWNLFTKWLLNNRKIYNNFDFKKISANLIKQPNSLNITKYSKQKLKYSWSDKNLEVINSKNSKVLPWFEGNAFESEIFDLSSSGLFNDTIFLSELLKTNLKTNLRYSKYIMSLDTDNANSKLILYSFYLKNAKIIKNNYSNNLENTKSLVSDISLNWNYDDTFEIYKQKIYLNTLSKFYEHNIYLKRLKNVNLEFPSNSQRSLTLLFNDQFNLINDSVFSIQSKEFGLVSTDFTGNLKKIKNKNLNTKLNNWNLLGGFSNLFSYSNYPNKMSNVKNLKIIGTNFSTRNNDFNLLSNFTKSLNISFGINREIGTIFANVKHNFDKHTKLDSDLYLSNPSDISKNHTKELFENTTNYTEEMDKLKIFWLPKKNLNDVGVDFWNKNITRNFNKKKTTADRFLSTFQKKIKLRENFVNLNLPRVDNEAVKTPSVVKLVQNVGKVNFRERIKLNSVSYLSDNFNKSSVGVNKNFNKITLVSDNELFENAIRLNIDKPHTLYGYLWDEYLKQTYGVNLNFVNFNKKIEDITFKDYNNFSLSSGNFQNNLEDSLKTENMFIGLTKDREIANLLTSKLLPKMGFTREIVDIEKFRNWRREEGSLGFDENLPFIESFWNSQKKEMFSDIIFKKKLIKKSIENIKKYSETPSGLKKTNTPIDIKLPYLKRKLWVKNEKIYDLFFKSPKKTQWLDYKNNKVNFINRLDLTTQLTENDYWGAFENIKRTNWQEYAYRSEMLNNSLDFEFGSKIEKDDYILNTLQESFLYFDSDTDGYLANTKLSKLKRSSVRQESLDREIQIMTNASEFKSAFLNTNEELLRKKKRNFRLFKKLELYGDAILSNSGISKYRNNLGFEKNIFMVDIQNIRKNQQFGDFFTYKNPIIEQIRSSNFKLKKINQVFLKKMYKKHGLLRDFLALNKDNDNFLNSIIENFPSKTLLENAINPLRPGNLKISKNFKLKNYMSNPYFGYQENNVLLFDNFSKDSILKIDYLLKKNIFSFDSETELLNSSFSTKVTKYSIKYNYMGLSNKLTDSFSTYENFFNSKLLNNSDSFLNKNLIFYKQVDLGFSNRFKSASQKFQYFYKNLKSLDIFYFFINKHKPSKFCLMNFLGYNRKNIESFLLIWKTLNIYNLSNIDLQKQNFGIFKNNALYFKQQDWFLFFKNNYLIKQKQTIFRLVKYLFFTTIKHY